MREKERSRVLDYQDAPKIRFPSALIDIRLLKDEFGFVSAAWFALSERT
jgi:hypothetical protein